MPGLLLLIEPGCLHLIWCEFLFVLLQYVINVRVGFKILIGFIGIFHFVQLYLHLSRGLMLVVLCSVLKKVVTMCYQNSKLVLGVLFVFYAGEIISPLWDL